MKLTVFGATGGIGREVVRQALASGHEVTAVIRQSSTLDTPGAKVFRVSGLTDPELLAEAVRGSDAVISGVGPRSSKEVTVASGTARVILKALESQGVRRFVAVSAAPVGPVPAGESWLNKYLLLPMISRLLRGIYADLRVMEDEIAASATDWTVVRPPKLDDKPLTGRYRMAIGANVPRGYVISRADVAHAMLRVLTDQATIKQAVGVCR